jgi:hypothetical protein
MGIRRTASSIHCEKSVSEFVPRLSYVVRMDSEAAPSYQAGFSLRPRRPLPLRLVPAIPVQMPPRKQTRPGVCQCFLG